MKEITLGFLENVLLHFSAHCYIAVRIITFLAFFLTNAEHKEVFFFS